MKLSTTLKFSPGYAGIEMDLVWEAERLGFAAVWAGEAYGTDAVSPIACFAVNAPGDVMSSAV